MMSTTLRPNQYICDNCGEIREREDVKLVGNPNIHEKDMLVFCQPDELDETTCEDQYNHAMKYDCHAVCNHCRMMINTMVQKVKVVNGNIYHLVCWDKKVEEIEQGEKKSKTVYGHTPPF